MKKVFRKIHLFLSIPLGLIITVICFSGAILVFQTEINELTRPELYFVKEISGEPLPVEELVLKANSQLTDRTVSSVQIPSDPKRNYVMGLSGGGRATGYVNPYTGELVGTTQRGEGFFSIMLQLHRWLLSRDIGKPIVGYTTLFFVFILITGVIVWWPKSKKQLKNRLQIKTRNGRKRFWYDLHISGGIYVLIGLLVLSLTGLTYSFRWYSKAFYGAFGIEVVDRGHGGNTAQNQNTTNNQGQDSSRSGGEHSEIFTEGEENDNKTQRRQGRGGKRPQFSETENNDSIPRGERRNRGRAYQTTSESSDSIPHKGRGRGQRSQFTNANTKDSVVQTQSNYRRGEGNSHRADTEDRAARSNDSPQKEANIKNWQVVVDKLKKDNPNFRNISIRDGSATVTQTFTFGNIRASDRYEFNPQSGEIASCQLYKDQDKSVKVRGWVYSLHVGAWGGLFSKILTCIISLLGAVLPLTGYYIYYIKRKKRKHIS